MRLVFMGPPGVGKGTYATAVSREFGIPHISTGDMIREEMKSGSELGVKLREYVEKGLLVPDELVTEMVRKRLSNADCSLGFILDGYPRTLKQVEDLDKITKIDLVINFTARDEVIIDRISGRRICRNCGTIYHIKYMPPKTPGVCDKCGGELYQREDDKPEVVKKRLEVYRQQFAAIIDHYRARGLLAEVDASEQAEVVIPRVFELLRSKGFTMK
ncbi:MAG: adenylate kinase [Thermofilaceae archaeon]|nr:adenylate kinase [Thermofilaceae archaeon]MCX8180319.1 adenylate kinase [Thermofilaceae archaeon]MDW8003854.1 adenylate kinase [Thermofilaceae archaeon]